MALLEPYVIPGFGKALLELLIILGTIFVAGLTIIVSSIVGIVRARRRRRRNVGSVGAVVLASLATITSAGWLLYWVASNVHERSNPVDSTFAINSSICVLAIWWLLAALRTNSRLRSQVV